MWKTEFVYVLNYLKTFKAVHKNIPPDGVRKNAPGKKAPRKNVPEKIAPRKITHRK